MKCLVVGERWLDLILSRRKTWELRGSHTHIRGKIGLIQSGSGLILGTCEVVGSKGPLSQAELRRTVSKHRVPANELRYLPYDRTYAWVLKNARRYPRPRRYNHPRGAVIWVDV